MIAELYDMCKSRGDFVFTNAEVRAVCAKVGFSNQYDATKIDSLTELPDALTDDDAFVVHLGRGSHQFVFGIASGYHRFEDIPDSQKLHWPYRRSILNNINTSGSNILAAGYNQRIIHDFLYGDMVASPKVHLSNRTEISSIYRVGNDNINAGRVRVRIDMTTEYLGAITVFDAPNGIPGDFNVFRLFNPFHFYLQGVESLVNSIDCCYLLRKGNRLRLYLYRFEDPYNPGSIKLARNAEYTLVER